MTPETFRQEKENQKATLFLNMGGSSTPPNVRDDGTVYCKLCGSRLGDVRDVRCYLLSHHLIMDGTLHERVTPFPTSRPSNPMDGRLLHQILIDISFIRQLGKT